MKMQQIPKIVLPKPNVAYQFAINKTPRNVVQPFIQTNNMAYNAYHAMRNVKAIKSAFNYALASYIALLCDIASQGIDEMYEYWKDTQFYAENKGFASKLKNCDDIAQKRYYRICSLAKDKQFFADLCDAGQEYIQPTFLKLFEDCKKMYKELGCKRYVAVAQATANFVMTNAVSYRVRDLVLDAEASGVKIDGDELYCMYGESKLLADIIEDLVKVSPDISTKISKIVSGISKEIQPSKILKHAGKVAMKLNPQCESDFKKQTVAIFEGFSWDD